MQKKLAKKRDLKCIKKIEKAGGDDTKPKQAQKRNVQPKSVPNTGAKTKSV